MIDTLGSLESGEKYLLKVPGLPYEVRLPYVILQEEKEKIRIVSFNLVGQIRLNKDLGVLIAKKIMEVIPELENVAILTVVEKALQLTQVVSQNLGIDAVAVAYNRIKPHMESERRPIIQVGADSITSGGKFLALYERDLNLIANASGGIIFIDDVVSTGGTVFALTQLVEEVARYKDMPVPPEILGIFCVAREGTNHPLLPAPLYSLTGLPDPQVISTQ